MTNELLPEVVASDLVVYATPLYYKTMNALMSIFRERMLPLSQPFIEERNGKTAFLMRHKLAPTVWLSVCGFPEESQFDAFFNFLNSTCHPDIPIIAEICRTSSEALKHPVFKKVVNDILEATRQAGHELVRSMKVSPDTMRRIRQPLMDPEGLAIMGNLTWRSCIAENMTPREFLEKGMRPRPDSLEAFMVYSALGLNAEAAGGKKVILQFKFSGEVEASCYFTFEKRSIKATAGTSATYDVRIDTPFELWMDIMTGKAEGREAFMQGEYKVEGDLSLMQELFKREGR